MKRKTDTSTLIELQKISFFIYSKLSAQHYYVNFKKENPVDDTKNQKDLK